MKFTILITIILTFSLIQAQSEFGDFTSINYQVKSAKEKSDLLWEAIQKNQTPYGWYSLVKMGIKFFSDFHPTFNHYADHFPAEGRAKFIHAVGNVAKARLVPEPGQPYTGIFKGHDNVLIRLSCAKEPKANKDPLDNFTPGMAVKFLRDGMPSANTITMFSVNGQDSWNFFSKDFSNHIPAAKGFALKLLEHQFADVTPYTGTIGSRTLGEYGEDGQKEENPKYPFQIIFRAHPDVSSRFSDNYTEYFVDQLKTIEPETKLYNVLAVENPGDEPQHIGTIVLDSKLITSYFGDKHLFFQHNFQEDDFEIHPEWKRAIDNKRMLKSEFLRELGKSFH